MNSITVIKPDINDIAAEMLEYNFSGERSVPFAEGEHYRRMGCEPSLKDISYGEAYVNATMRIYEREMAPWYDYVFEKHHGGSWEVERAFAYEEYDGAEGWDED